MSVENPWRALRERVDLRIGGLIQRERALMLVDEAERQRRNPARAAEKPHLLAGSVMLMADETVEVVWRACLGLGDPAPAVELACAARMTARHGLERFREIEREAMGSSPAAPPENPPMDRRRSG